MEPAVADLSLPCEQREAFSVAAYLARCEVIQVWNGQFCPVDIFFAKDVGIHIEPCEMSA